jgi:hypothetical protein
LEILSHNRDLLLDATELLFPVSGERTENAGPLFILLETMPVGLDQNSKRKIELLLMLLFHLPSGRQLGGKPV